MCYGLNEPFSLSVSSGDLLKLRRQQGENAIFQLSVEGESKSERTVMVKALQVDPVQRSILHADFLEISLDRTIDVDVPVILDGTPIGVDRDGGVLTPYVRQVVIRCLPTRIPDALHLDVSEIELGNILHVRDLVAGEGIEVLTDGDEPLAGVAMEKVIEEEVPAEVAEGEEAEAPSEEETPEGEAGKAEEK